MTAIRFDDQVVLVTGAGRGLGAAYARAFAARGASVVVHDAGVTAEGEGGDPAVADAVADELRRSGATALARYENLESERACVELVEAALERFGRLDAVVHNAGLVRWDPIEDAAGWARSVHVNLHAPYHVTRAALPAMKRRGYGRFVFTTSGRAMWLEAVRPGLAGYAAAKIGQFGLMLATAVEGAEHGIHANAVSPVAATRVLRRTAEPGEADPEQVAPGVLFLASERCAFSGAVLRAAGGRFSVARWEVSDEIDLGREPAPPELIADRWIDIEGAVTTP